MRVTWLGHAAFEVEIDGVNVLIDPFLSGNPKAAKSPDEVDPDLVLVTHGHGDHLGDAVEICKRTGATLVGIYEIAMYAKGQGVENVEEMNIGGTIEVEGLRIIQVPAWHSSEIVEDGEIVAGGTPVGYVVSGEEGSVYHAGDTGLSMDMKLIGELYEPEVALLPIGSRFTMGPKEAAKAVELIEPEVVIPMHYGTFPPIDQDPEEFEREVKELGLDVEVVILEPGESYER
ncbi:metal-dependent hydrolase [Methanopyrus sp. KOL6]|uniref:metal-dependent hydrolase n=1 Tax=Methanopyrus sp. KOL6 TaxID=1937004 RepID=UPI000B4BD2C0|nr:metal-dependent hydrolase [Methanopyrus sp. KOL6]